MKPGTQFVHRHWLDADNRPLICEVTAVRRGTVYWRDAGTTGRARYCFPVEQTERWVSSIVAPAGKL